MMQKILISMPANLLSRLRATIPERQRSKFIAAVVEKELKKREEVLYQCALEVEKNDALNSEMSDWDVSVADGLENDSW